jgi:prophage tail gpP-like protein
MAVEQKMPEAKLFVGGKVYDHWKTIEVTRSLKTIAGEFTLSVTESKRQDGQIVSWIIQYNDRCRLQIDGIDVVSGHIKTYKVKHNATTHTVTITGRDATADAVDCAAIFKTGEWTNSNLIAIAGDVLEPFSLTVHDETGGQASQKIAKVAIQQGETAFSLIARLAKMAGVMVTTDGHRTVILTTAGRSGRAQVGLVLGENILDADSTWDGSKLFTKIIVRGQSTLATITGANNGDLAHAAEVLEAVSKGNGQQRYRAKVIAAEANMTAARALSRAKFEASKMLGDARQYVITTTGWYAGKALWQPNTLCKVTDAYLHVDEDLLIDSVRFSLGEGGFKTTLGLCPPQAYQLLSTLPPPVAIGAKAKPVKAPTKAPVVVNNRRLQDKRSR